MNTSNLTILRTLIAKDWRLFRVPMIALIVCGLGAYLIATCVIVEDRWDGSNAEQHPAFEIFFAAAVYAIGLTGFLACAFGGVAIAAERSDRSCDFIGLLPVTRAQIILSKLLSSAMMLGIFAVIHFVLAIVCLTQQWKLRANPIVPADVPWGMAAESALLWLGCALCLFGVGWLFSTFLNSGPISACISIAVLVTAWCVAGYYVDISHLREWQAEAIIIAVVSSIGLPSLVGGSIYYLRRIAP
jgi:ABC-type transport system involved in multi-copper enzyme maturation permease subunit